MMDWVSQILMFNINPTHKIVSNFVEVENHNIVRI